MPADMEYTTIWVHWNEYFNNDVDNTKNFKKNMEVFDERVNGFIKEGWRPKGPPQFSAGWFSGCTASGSVVQALIRETEYDITEIDVELPVRRSGRVRSNS
jgi:hypothetical protein